MNIKSFMFLSLITFVYSGIGAQSTTLTPVVCQNQKCYLANIALTREAFFKRIQNLLDNNINNNILLCEANPQSKMCLTNGFSIPIQSPLIRTELEVLSAKITDQQNVTGTTGADLIFDYKIKSKNVHPTCQTAPSRLGVLDYNSVQIMAQEFSCTLTHSNQTSLNLIYDIDYVNFDNGTIGAYYNITAGQNAIGQKNGYLLFRFTQPATPVLTEEFPMIEAIQNHQIEQQKAQAQIDPVWMKPTPMLNGTVNQNIVIAEGNQPLFQATTNPPSPPIDGPATTSGLITQDKNILPPVNGIRKTVTIKKQIFQKGKPVIYEEDVQRYIQEHKDAPLIEEKEYIEQEKKKELKVPEMPKRKTVQQNIPPQMPTYIFPHEVMLTEEEIAQIQNQMPVEYANNYIEQEPIAEKEDKSFLSKLFGSDEE